MVRSKNRKPPSYGHWQATVPLWEKKFCTQVGSIPWQKISDAKKMMSYYPNVVQWNDSAAEEAFNNAKNRFRAEINGYPYDIPLPDPDIYIDEIDWDSYIDPQLFLDLDRALEEENNRSLGILADTPVLLNQPIQATGWGDAEDDPTVTTNIHSSSGPGLGGNGGDNPWEHSCNGDNSWGRNCNEGARAVKNSSWGNNFNWFEHFGSSRTVENWGTLNANCRMKNGKERKTANFVYEHPVMHATPLLPTRWKSVSTCGPISHHKSDGAGRLWSCDKPVS